MVCSTESVTYEENGDIRRGSAHRTKARERGLRAKEKERAKVRTGKDSNRQRDNKEAKAEAHPRG